MQRVTTLTGHTARLVQLGQQSWRAEVGSMWSAGGPTPEAALRTIVRSLGTVESDG